MDYTQEELESEEWRTVKDFPDYMVSDLGRVKRVRVLKYHPQIEKPLKFYQGNSGHLLATLCNGGDKRSILVHRLVGIAFLDPPESANQTQINHKDGVKTNNRSSNLEWSSASEDAKHAYRLGLRPIGEKHGMAVLTNDEVDQIRKLHKDGESKRSLAGRFKTSKTTISRIVNRLVRNHDIKVS